MTTTNQPAAELLADRIILAALETHGSQVIFDSEKGIVVACPVSSMCEGTPDHEPDCWLGQAMRYMPTSDCPRAIAAAVPLDARERWVQVLRQMGQDLGLGSDRTKKIEDAIAATPTTNAATGAQTCAKCGHAGELINGYCTAIVKKGRVHGLCGCKCEFPATTTAAELSD